ncbi:DUF805 domain-containing protein [Alphaproteobacteria bacterium]|nr:DUF805 domain-containing protein [Alphaproteobacteria bacterium]
MFEALKKYAVFTGRSGRKEYWLFVLLCIILQLFTEVLNIGPSGPESFSGRMGFISAIIFFALLIPSISVLVRRLHDTDRSGWWVLIIFVPAVGVITLFIFACLEGTKGKNRFGAAPKS